MRGLLGSSGRSPARRAARISLKEEEMKRSVRYALIAACVLVLYYLLYALARSFK